MTMINNNLPITQAQKQREELESPAAAPMAAPQGTAFRGKEEDEDKNKTLKIVGTTLALAAAGIYCIKSYNQGDWKFWTGDWWKGAAKSAQDAALDKAVRNIPADATWPQPAAQQTGALVENAANMKVEPMDSNIEAALKAKGKSNIADLLGNEDGIDFAEGKTLHVVKDKKSELIKAWIEKDDSPAGKKSTKFYFNSQGEQVAKKTYVEDKGRTGFLTSTFKDASGNIRHNNGAGRKLEEAALIFDGGTATKGIGKIEATTQGEKHLWTALQGDMDSTQLGATDTAAKELRKAFNEKSKFGKALQAQNKWSEKQTTDIMNAFLTKFKVADDSITPAAVQKFINEYGGKHVTVTKPALKNQSLVMAFTSDKNVLHHMTHYNADTKEVTRYSNFSKALTDALGEAEVDPLTLFNADGFNISGVQKAEHGYIGQIEKFKAAKKAKDGKELLVSTSATVKSGSNYGENTELVLTQRTQTAHVSKDKLGSGASPNIREGRAVVTTSYAIDQDDLSNPTTAADLRKKITGATVKKSIQPGDKDPKEVFSLTFKDRKAQSFNVDAMQQDQLTLTAMLEGTKEDLGDDTAQATKTVMYLLGHTDDKFSIAADTAVAAKSGALAKDPTGYHAGYLKGLLGTTVDLSDDKTMVKQLDKLTPDFIKDSTSMKLIKYNDSYSHKKSETEKDKGVVRSHTTYDDNGKIKSELTYDEDSGLYLETQKGDTKAVYGKFDDTKLAPTEQIAHFDSGKWHSDCETTFEDAAGSIGKAYKKGEDTADNVTWITKGMKGATIDLKGDVQTLRKYTQDGEPQDLATITMGWQMGKGQEVNGITISATDKSQIYKFKIGEKVTYRKVWRDSDGGFRMGQAADSIPKADDAISGAGTVAIGRFGVDKIKHNGELDVDAQAFLQSLDAHGGRTAYVTGAGGGWVPTAKNTNRIEDVDGAMNQYEGILKYDSTAKGKEDSAAKVFKFDGYGLTADGMDAKAAAEAKGGLDADRAKDSVTAAQKSIDLTLANFFLNVLGICG